MTQAQPENINPGLSILKSIDINASPLKVWDVLTNPAMIKQFFTGAQTITNWQIGSEIVFIHWYEEKEFRNKGTILQFLPNKVLSYTYWTAFSNTEDKPENYTTITYTLEEMNGKTKLSLAQTNFKNAAWYEGLQAGWDIVLIKIKEMAEQ
jgi:uncharacterized protein YndB with AHSA1/START domain